jgi:hypothetical protein
MICDKVQQAANWAGSIATKNAELAPLQKSTHQAEARASIGLSGTFGWC